MAASLAEKGAAAVLGPAVLGPAALWPALLGPALLGPAALGPAVVEWVAYGGPHGGGHLHSTSPASIAPCPPSITAGADRTFRSACCGVAETVVEADVKDSAGVTMVGSWAELEPERRYSSRCTSYSSRSRDVWRCSECRNAWRASSCAK
eukprot:scaffold94615_cov60-Phaeocystis_antarctica.AAC.1